MKTLSITAILFVIFANCMAQSTFKVIRVNGEIVLQKTGKNLTTGLEFTDNDKLNFKTPTAKAAVINPEKGRLVLAASNNSSGYNLLPPKQNIDVRGTTAILNDVDMLNSFKGSIAIIDQVEYLINNPKYTMGEGQFFYLRYSYNGEEINKKLSHNGKNLIFKRTEILQVDKKPIISFDSSDVKLYYYKNDTSYFISSFNLVFPDKNTLETEVKVIWDSMSESENSEKLNDIKGYLSEFYGKLDEDDFTSWISGVFELDK